jgi:2-C-methyl-D-erythritol 4-phosphate cytidylyltransferase / 2-C-methyl-D-erythritol 2,4-cyclodiphosphate synthase
MNNYFVILAAGKGKRFSKYIPKQFLKYKNKDIIDHSITKSLDANIFKKVIVVTNNLNEFKNKKYSKLVKVIKGGKERYDSSLLALRYIKKFKPKNVLIHDAARPNFSTKLLKKLVYQLKKNKAVVPVIVSRDSVKYKIKNQVYNLKRKNVYLTQTPQAFRFKDLFNLSINQKKEVTDEAALFIENNLKIKFINGDSKNIKITYKDDVNFTRTYFGIGFDIHRLIKNKKLYLGGIKIPFHSGLKGHSDGDVILHTITDALLGAIQGKDIGTYFPSNKKKFKDIRSSKMLKPILENIYKKGFSINNLDINLICEKPKVSVYRNRIINSIANIMNLDKEKINLKGKTVEKLGLIGKENAIACEAIISITKYD